MKRLSFLVLVALLFAPLVAARAGDGDYDDPAMHFSPPADFTRVPLAAPPDDHSGNTDDAAKAPVAVYVSHAGKRDVREIVITIDPDDSDSLDNFERAHESEVRQASDGTFVVGKTKIALANGMPAWFLKINQGNEIGHFVRRDEYLVVDGKRSIDVEYVGRQGDFEDSAVTTALASLSVVLYPHRR